MSDCTTESETDHTMDSHMDDVPRTDDDRKNTNDAALMSFLATMRKVQRDHRKEKLRKVNSFRGSFLSPGSGPPSFQPRGTVSAQADFDERSPLTAAGLQKPSLGGDNVEANVDRIEQMLKQSEEEEETKVTVWQYLCSIIFGKGPVSLCWICMPLSLVAQFQGWSDSWIFWLNFFLLIPLATILGDFTEEVALHTGQVVGGLINATFSNAFEVVVVIQALRNNEIRVVQASMLGSIFSNLLLVLGCCFFFGGMYYKEQSFNSTAATSCMGLLALSSIALVLPTPFAEYYEIEDEHVLIVSRVAAIFMIFMYSQLLIFQLHTHSHVFEDGDDDELASIPLWVSSLGLFFTTVLVAIFSDFLVESINGFTEASGVSKTFVGLILIPIVGNAVEHVAAVIVSMKDKMDLAMGICVGSCTQISLLVVPFAVLFGWCIDKDMTLNFPHFEIALYILSVFTVSIILGYPHCNWLEGSLLITTYCLIAVGFWFEAVRDF